MCGWWWHHWEHSLLLNSFAYLGAFEKGAPAMTIFYYNLMYWCTVGNTTPTNMKKLQSAGSSGKLEFLFFIHSSYIQEFSHCILVVQRCYTSWEHAAMRFQHFITHWASIPLTSLQPEHYQFSMTGLSKYPLTIILLHISTNEVKHGEGLVTRLVARMRYRFFSTYFEGYWTQQCL
jgi:hypothetical protein